MTLDCRLLALSLHGAWIHLSGRNVTVGLLTFCKLVKPRFKVILPSASASDSSSKTVQKSFVLRKMHVPAATIAYIFLIM